MNEFARSLKVCRKSRTFLAAMILVTFGAVTEGAAKGRNSSLTITSFNIKYYGTGGAMEGDPSSEFRDPYLKEFLQKNVPASDVMAFQEITDPDRLNNILPAGFNCETYDNEYENHQFVVLCHSPNYKFLREPNDNNNIIDEVSYDGGKSRPALHFIVADKTGRPLVRVIAVHLKAYPEESPRRQEQVQIISEYLQTVENPNLPVVITGDFNTFPADKTGEEFSDVEIFNDIFETEGTGLVYANHPAMATWRNPKNGRSKFDHFWISESLHPVGPVKTFDVCSLKAADETSNRKISGNPFLDINYYYKNVSDHCPVTLKVAL